MPKNKRLIKYRIEGELASGMRLGSHFPFIISEIDGKRKLFNSPSASVRAWV